jgi:hypothetical protein
MAELQACIRQNGHVDLYVLNVPGMPSRWVYLLDAPLERVQQEFEGFQIPEGAGEEPAPAPAPPEKKAAGLNEEPGDEKIAAIAEKPETVESAIAEVALE